MSNYEKQRVAYHEAGHLLVAAHEGFESLGIVVRDNMSGHAESSPRLPGRTSEQYVSSRLRVLLAGALAQCIKLHPGDSRCVMNALLTNGNANDDWCKAEELARAIAHGRTGGAASDDKSMAAAADEVIREHSAQAQKILESNRKVLDKLARLVIDRFADLCAEDINASDSDSKLEVTEAEVKRALDGMQRVYGDSA
ncbi:hypothetical protein [Pyxidicoccus caerfyrddinensis]|uniref:hypothetical protein n=1 Tax=Pyxidicoccus caerfyrddinensis TaxID=2709663 RepID=UPI0013DD1580|nr:hypothetical protein [Pyxidicoccus caerfyrddinensis]